LFYDHGYNSCWAIDTAGFVEGSDGVDNALLETIAEPICLSAGQVGAIKAGGSGHSDV